MTLNEQEIALINDKMGPLIDHLGNLEKSNAKKDIEIIVLKNAYENVAKQVEEIVKVIKAQAKRKLKSSTRCEVPRIFE